MAPTPRERYHVNAQYLYVVCRHKQAGHEIHRGNCRLLSSNLQTCRFDVRRRSRHIGSEVNKDCVLTMQTCNSLNSKPIFAKFGLLQTGENEHDTGYWLS